MLSPLDPLAAYREDLARSGRETLASDDGIWIEVAVLLRRIGQLSDTTPAIREAAEREIARRLDEIGLDPDTPRGETPGADPRVLFTRIRLLADRRMDMAGGASLATAMLRAAELAYPGDECDRGRSMLLRARIARYAGSLEVAEQLTGAVLRIGRRRRSMELAARACTVRATICHERGNYPRMERWARRGLAYATAGNVKRARGAAHQSLMITAAVRRDFGVALHHGWLAYQEYVGDIELEATALMNLSKLLLDAGRPSTAVHGFIATLALRSTMLVNLFAWGGLSLAGAGIGDVVLVELASDRILALADTSALPYPVATALVSCAKARASVGMPNEPWIARAAALAERGGYHELSIEIDELRSGCDRRGQPMSATLRNAPAVAKSPTFVDGPQLGEMIDAIESMARIEDVYTVT